MISLFACSNAHSQVPEILLQDYSFLVADGEVERIKQRNDTLYKFNCVLPHSTQSCFPESGKSYRIIAANRSDDVTVLKLERLDSISMTTNPYPPTRYSIVALKAVDNKDLGFLPLESDLTKEQLDTIETNVQELENKFFYSYYSDSYLKELAALKRVETKEQANEIVNLIKSEEFEWLVERYKKTEVPDMYGSGLAAEIINRACIKLGYNPSGAGQAINSFMRE